jgi:asparagine synthase (glutamine-hydrolysing)
MKGLREKHILKQAAHGLVPESVVNRAKQPYRAPDVMSFFPTGKGQTPPEYVRELLSAERIRRDGVFRPEAVEPLVRKAQRGDIIGQRDNMAVVGLLTTQLLVEQFIHNPPAVSTRAEPRPAVTWQLADDGAAEESLDTPSPVR